MRKWWVLAGILILGVLLACGSNRNDYKGRPIPKRSITCYDGTQVKDVGPWSCDDHGGKAG